MHTVELLEEAVQIAAKLGCRVRQDWLAGMASGACELKGKRWIFIDLALSPREQLQQVLEGIAWWGGLPPDASPELHALLKLRKAA